MSINLLFLFFIRLLDSDLKTLVNEKSEQTFPDKFTKLSYGIADIVSILRNFYNRLTEF